MTTETIPLTQDQGGARPTDWAGGLRPEPKVSALSGAHPSRVEGFFVFVGTAVGIAAALSMVVAVAGLVLELAAMFAWGDDKPATPWFLYRFFLALAVLLSPFAALLVLCSRDSDRSGEAVETTGSTEGESAGPTAIAQTPPSEPTP